MIKSIPNFPNHTIDELGNIYNIKLDRYLKPGKTHPKNDTLYIRLTHKGYEETFQVAKLVLSLFQSSQTNSDTQAIHKDLCLQNCANFNLKAGTRGDRLRMFYEIKKKLRGVYPWKAKKANWRVVLKNPAGDTKTIGYYKNKWYAQYMFNKTYKEFYGRLPY